ncbi:MAG: immunity 17 family protein [Massilibacteroides sp.]|nr:immunity 17 family protein [Massilibacteroides sp.]MDD3062139.1 immunity 17 family protein [Massilibacteroides sp.]MDD4115023.1 immunity 17 family protein [Massilibacteroides sp.]MDD4660300.1 immunity 17 family protein [Massilibacteroides sp.]
MNIQETLIFFIFLLLGTFSLIAAIFNFDWYFNTQGASLFIKWFGRSGARLFYALLGLALLFCGIAGLLSST